MIAPNEGRRQLDLPPVPGGDTPYLQVQNYSLEALAKRDAREGEAPSEAPQDAPEAPDAAKYLTALLRTKRLEDFAHA